MSFDSLSIQSEIRNPNSEIENVRILLWDIDGTLIHSKRSGSFSDYFIPTLEEVYGTAGSLAAMRVSGMTDTQIAYEALRGEGFEVSDIFAKIDRFIEVLGRRMSAVIEESDDRFGVFAGVREVLSKTASDPLFINSLLTGNLSVAAEIKLRSVDLWHYFDGRPHAYGEISHRRGELALFAGRKYSEYLSAELKPDQFIVIGDTPNDIACARHFGARAVAVATGRIHSAEELAECEPDVLLEDLRDTENVLEVLQNL
jgi:phosphoglycolate phosphatase